ncbi:hypothetical protein D3C71_719200 [compost metagenome]
MKIFGNLIVVATLLLPHTVSACQFINPKPEDVMGLEENLVVAYPSAISNIPRAAENPNYREEFRQTIRWTVVVSWKGRYKAGDQFTTRQTLSRAGMCTPGAGNYTKKPLLLAFSGSEPYRSFWEFSVEYDLEKFRYLQEHRVRGRT